MAEKLTFTQKPSLGSVYFRVMFKGKSKLRKGESLPPMEAQWMQALEEPARLSAYRAICGYAEDGKLPLIYPYVKGAGMQICLMAHPKFPLSPMGAVHARNHILQFRPIAQDEPLDLLTLVGESRIVKQGLEFDTIIEGIAGKERVWECVSTYLMRGKHFGAAEATPARAVFPDLTDVNHEAGWAVSSDIGRRYARITGDYNPIHLYPLLAKLFGGFPKAIAHGMWSLAKCVANLPTPEADRPIRLDVAFKGPVFQPSKVILKANCTQTDRRFDLFCEGNPRPVAVGALYNSQPGEHLF